MAMETATGTAVMRPSTEEPGTTRSTETAGTTSSMEKREMTASMEEPVTIIWKEGQGTITFTAGKEGTPTASTLAGERTGSITMTREAAVSMTV